MIWDSKSLKLIDTIKTTVEVPNNWYICYDNIHNRLFFSSSDNVIEVYAKK